MTKLELDLLTKYWKCMEMHGNAIVDVDIQSHVSCCSFVDVNLERLTWPRCRLVAFHPQFARWLLPTRGNGSLSDAMGQALVEVSWTASWIRHCTYRLDAEACLQRSLFSWLGSQTHTKTPEPSLQLSDVARLGGQMYFSDTLVRHSGWSVRSHILRNG